MCDLIIWQGLGFSLFFIGVFGILFNRNNFLVVLLAIEIILLSVNLEFLIYSVLFDDLIGQVFALFILTVAAAESAIGLGILILYYRYNYHIGMGTINLISD